MWTKAATLPKRTAPASILPSMTHAVNAVRKHAVPLSDVTAARYSHILDNIGDAQIVLIGEASHGTEEFYAHRAELTKHLIETRGFNCVACEADWPDAYRVNRYIQRGQTSRDHDAASALGDFKRFPMWMWRNTVVADFVEWLRQYNDHHLRRDAPHGRVAFYGLDLYSFYTSMDEVVEYLEKVSPEDAKRAKETYSVFDQFQGEPAAYGMAAAMRLTPSFKKEVVQTLNDLRIKGEEYLKGRGGLIDGDELFYATQNAALVARAEEYYRNMVSADELTWNLRDDHMAKCVTSLLSFQKQKSGSDCKMVIWAHNSHVGDARATASRRQRGEWNVGQLLRQRIGMQKVYTIGFNTYSGSVTAAREWDAVGEFKEVRNGLATSYEHLFHSVSEQLAEPDFALILRSLNPAAKKIDPAMLSLLNEPRLERFIGVIYRPDTEKASHYTVTKMPEEYDAVIFIDRSNALEPLDTTMPWLDERASFVPDVGDGYPELENNHPAEQHAEWRLKAAAAINDSGNMALQAGNAAHAIKKYEKAERYLKLSARLAVDEQVVSRLRAAISFNRALALLQLNQSAEASEALDRGKSYAARVQDQLLERQASSLATHVKSFKPRATTTGSLPLQPVVNKTLPLAPLAVLDPIERGAVAAHAPTA